MEEKQVKAPRTRSKRAVRDSAALSVSPAPKKRAVRKVAPKKGVAESALKRAPSKTATKKRTVVKKSKNIEAMAELSVSHESPATHAIPIVRNQLQLALLSPFRFPLDHSTLAAQAARIAGVAFVLIGAFFTLFNMHTLSGSMLGSYSEGERQLASTFTTYDCTDTASPYYNETYCAAQAPGGTLQTEADPTPDVELRIDAPNPYTNIVPVQIIVPYATQVVVSAYSRDEGRTILLGNASKQSDLHWVYYWDTKKYPDGVYRLKLVVTNIFGSYTESDSTDRIVANYTNTIENTSSGSNEGDTTATSSESISGSGSSSSGTTTQATASEPVSIKLAINEEPPLEGTAAISVYVDDAKSVKLYAKNINTGSYMSLGYATFKGENEWRYVWNTEVYPNGDYVVRAHVGIGDTYIESEYISTKVLNEQTTETAMAPTTTPTNIAPTTTLEKTIPESSKINFLIAGSNPRSGETDVFVTYPNARFVEFYVMPKFALVPRFLGLAVQRNADEWRYRWNTQNTPNGEHVLYARVGTAFGPLESERRAVTVFNTIETEYTPAEETYLEDIEDVTALLETVTDKASSNDASSTTEFVPTVPKTVLIKPITEVVTLIEVHDDEREEIARHLVEFRTELDAVLLHYAEAVRADDASAIEAVLQEIEALRAKIIETLPISPERLDVIEKIDTELRVMIAMLTEVTKRNEMIIKERIGDRVFADADRDGISDYDEINLYGTNPFSADTDSDGFTDGAEMLSGFNPLDPAAEALITHESPKETGLVRDDLLAVQSITTLPRDIDEVDGDGVPVSAVISGTALPNSFVSLYIFSTPIVITVKTDEDGAWSYIFDKELENGEHEIYVAFTDNAGRVIAKSSPLPFVKTAEAFTPIDANAESALAVSDAEPSLITDTMLITIASISIVALGLVLLLLGLHMGRKQEAQVALQ